MPPRLDITGQRFGKLVAMKDVGTKYYRRLWVCQCDCGRKIHSLVAPLINGHIQSCGCRHKENVLRLPKAQASINELYRSYRHQAYKKKRPFNLTIQDFRNLTSSNCYYCGRPPTQRAGHQKNNGYYYYNGIDRVDSTLGYDLSNVVPCCKQCNIAKHDYTTEQFYNWIKVVYRKVVTNE